MAIVIVVLVMMRMKLRFKQIIESWFGPISHCELIVDGIGGRGGNGGTPWGSSGSGGGGHHIALMWLKKE